MANAAFIVLAALCVWAIVSREIHTGLLPTLGLALLVCALAAAIDDSAYIYRAFNVMVYGCLLVAAGLVWKHFGSPWFARFQVAKLIEAESRAWRKQGERR